MPFIHIRSLPLQPEQDIANILRQVSKAFASQTGVALEHVHATWTILPAGHYAKGRQTPSVQPETQHPVLIELLTPDFHDEQTVATMLNCIADNFSKATRLSKNNLFIHHQQARSGHVFDNGEIEVWDK